MIDLTEQEKEEIFKEAQLLFMQLEGEDCQLSGNIPSYPLHLNKIIFKSINETISKLRQKSEICSVCGFPKNICKKRIENENI